MDVKTIKQERVFRVPHKDIEWRLTRCRLKLRIVLASVTYGEKDVLSCIEWGQCTDWRHVLADDEDTALFTASWDVKRVDWDLFTSINASLALLAASWDGTHST